MTDEVATIADPQAALNEAYPEMLTRAARLHEIIEQPKEKWSETRDAELSAARKEILARDAYILALQRAIPPVQPVVGQGPQAATRTVSESRDGKTLGQQVADSAEWRGWVEKGAKGSVEVRASTITGPTDAALTSGGAFAPIMPFVLNPNAIRRDRLYVRDLFPNTTTTYEVINYIAETYVSGSDATTVSEAALKPQGNMNWSRQVQNITKIGVWVAATTEALTDYGSLMGAIDNRLTYKVNRAEEDRLINGNNVMPDLLGILNFPNLQTQAFSTNAFTTISKARVLIENHDADATGLVLNPTDYWAAMAASVSTLTGASPFQGPPDTIWGLPCVRSPRIAANTGILGDFTQGGEIFDRADINITVGDQHSDFFIRNMVAILAERREALVCYRGDLFVNITGVSS